MDCWCPLQSVSRSIHLPLAVAHVTVLGLRAFLSQIFINYKLKSVAHMPWRVLTYKAFNTFIDDVIAFGGFIHMPTKHRWMTLRDDLVFMVFLYQRYLYPIDSQRPDEFGFVYEEAAGEAGAEGAGGKGGAGGADGGGGAAAAAAGAEAEPADEAAAEGEEAVQSAGAAAGDSAGTDGLRRRAAAKAAD